jgi:hypothetical protein
MKTHHQSEHIWRERVRREATRGGRVHTRIPRLGAKAIAIAGDPRIVFIVCARSVRDGIVLCAHLRRTRDRVRGDRGAKTSDEREGDEFTGKFLGV